VQARFNESITNALFQACHAELLALGVAEKNITHQPVPVALEVPVALQALAERDEVDALIELGCIIPGETYHFELGILQLHHHPLHLPCGLEVGPTAPVS